MKENFEFTRFICWNCGEIPEQLASLDYVHGENSSDPTWEYHIKPDDFVWKCSECGGDVSAKWKIIPDSDNEQ